MAGGLPLRRLAPWLIAAAGLFSIFGSVVYLSAANSRWTWALRAELFESQALRAEPFESQPQHARLPQQVSAFVDATRSDALMPAPPPPPWPSLRRKAQLPAVKRSVRQPSPPQPPPPLSSPPPSPPSSSSDAPASSSVGGTASVALHKSAKQWLDRCVNASSIGTALPSSEYWRTRRHYALYKHLHCVLQRYADFARSALDVGSSIPPYLNALPWLTSRTILGPRFAGNVGKGGGELFSLKRIREKYNVSAIEADFLEWQPSTDSASFFDLVLCSEVVEHVPKPREFVRKLLTFGRVVVLAVPYKWDPCDDTKCHHVNNRITRDMIASWAGRQPNAFDIVEEESGEERIICVFRSDGAPRTLLGRSTSRRRNRGDT